MFKVKRLRGLEILDSRGRPTVKATCELASGAIGAASVPSGASTGSAEAVERRDGDPARYSGFGCRAAVHAINDELHAMAAGNGFASQSEWDAALIARDGSTNKSNLG